MHHFFIKPEQIYNNEIIITGNDFRHIKNVLRMKIGEEATLSDGENPLLYHGIIADLNNENVRFDLLYHEEINHELKARVYLFQSLPKASKMELIIQKAVELGVHEIIPTATDRSIVRLDEKKALAKVKRWQSISEAAAKQNKRGIVPIVREVMDFSQAISSLDMMEIKIIAYEMANDIEKTKSIIAGIKPGQNVAIFIGPEGGFSSHEIELATKAGITPVTMGKRILRTETAVFVILSWIMYHLEI
ncbi:MAG: 16S rRNA (uracil(1498)-N(3))-methyltransferase [Lachnospiraceae bacterium]|nr:16S rRNA (uracil(1498)-N(3))-methyltransferase [Lachnospiraceae bacterium]